MTLRVPLSSTNLSLSVHEKKIQSKINKAAMEELIVLTQQLEGEKCPLNLRTLAKPARKSPRRNYRKINFNYRGDYL